MLNYGCMTRGELTNRKQEWKYFSFPQFHSPLDTSSVINLFTSFFKSVETFLILSDCMFVSHTAFTTLGVHLL